MKLNPSNTVKKLFSCLTQCDTLFQNLLFTHAEYLSDKQEHAYDIQAINELLALIKEFVVKIEDNSNVIYSLSMINDYIVCQTDSTSSYEFIIGRCATEIRKQLPNIQPHKINVGLIGKALGDANRLQILQLLENGSMYASELAKELEIAHTSLFYHVTMLVEAELIRCNIEGRKTFYSINVDQMGNIAYHANLYYHKLLGGE